MCSEEHVILKSLDKWNYYLCKLQNLILQKKHVSLNFLCEEQKKYESTICARMY
jgi:hypothetical protein